MGTWRQVNEDAQRGELFEKSGRVNIQERRRQRNAQRNPAYRIGENLAGAGLCPARAEPS